MAGKRGHSLPRVQCFPHGWLVGWLLCFFFFLTKAFANPITDHFMNLYIDQRWYFIFSLKAMPNPIIVSTASIVPLFADNP